MENRIVTAVLKISAKLELPNWVTFGLLHLAARGVAFWIPNLFLYLIEKNKLFLRYKIQPTRAPKAELVYETLKHNILVDLVAYWPFAFFFYRLLTKGGDVKQAQNKSSEPEHTGEDTKKGKGWSNIRFGGPAPSSKTIVWQVLLAYLGYDFMFYWSHRLLHRPEFYKRIHKKHHMYHTPIGISSSNEHVVESIAQLFNWYLPLGFAGYLAGDLHSTTVFYYNAFRWLESVDAHCGYEFPFSPFHMLPFFGSATRHDYHHREFWGNYGATTFWDWLCGTDKEFWEEVAENAALKAKKLTA
mmetsp:Transcript_6637/g.8654  ORF Transcript_6637/g.8654 Transcript_6637/m.8654 type:complete len:300 (-) Transcript_6637:135-1034(-)